MEPLCHDMLFLIGTYLDLQDLYNFSITCVRIYQKLYLKKDIWNYKLIKEFPNEIRIDNNSKDSYIKLHHLNIIRRNLGLDIGLYNLFYIDKIATKRGKVLSFPKEISILSNLKELYLYGTMKKFPFHFSFPKNLYVLDLGRNKLKDISSNIFKSFRKLRVLDLSTNDLTKVPECVSLIDTLQVFHIDHNYIEIIENLPNNLIRLGMDYNRIKIIEKLPKTLEFLSLDYNEIKEVPWEDLPTCLRKLYVYGNPLREEIF